MKPHLVTYFLCFFNFILSSMLWIGQIWYFPEIHVWAHFFLSLISLTIMGGTLVLLGVQRPKIPRMSMVQLVLILFLNIVYGINGIWFFGLSSYQILF